MAIYPPGRRTRKNRIKASAKRKMVAQLSLTAMVTVLVVFLLMNYRTTDTVLYIPKEVQLPKASETKELKPAHVVTISAKEILIDQEVIASFREVKNQKGWMVINLRNRLIEMFRQSEVEYETRLRTQLRQATLTNEEVFAKERENLRRVTIQADKDIDFLTIKKIMYTVTEAGAREINFAVIVRPPPEDVSLRASSEFPNEG